MTESNNNAIPEGWSASKLSQLLIDPKADLVDGPFGSNLKRADYCDSGVPVFKIQNIKENSFVDGVLSYVSSEKAAELKRHSFKKGDLIITKLGNPLGLCCEVPPKYSEGIIVADLMRLRVEHEYVVKQYLIYLINSPVIQDQFKKITKGTTRPRVNLTIVRDLNFPLPPVNEQRRIVAKLEELFSELDKGIESLKTAQEQLKVYRQALLKHAFEGKLTEQWRKDNAGKLETADQLLERIKQEREARYQQQLEEWKAAVKEWEAEGKLGKRPTKPRKQKLPGPIDEEELSKLPLLPDNWKWVRLGTITWSVKDGPHYSPKYSESGIPFISGGNIRPSGVDFENVKYISEELHSELCKRCKPKIGDILYTKGGTTGIARVNTYEHEFNVWVHVAVLKIVESIKPFYLQHALNSPYPYSQAQKYTHGVGNQDLGLTRMVNIIIPICSAEEQEQIIEEVDRSSSVLDEFEEEIRATIEKSEILRQSILKKAFSGQLVPQDPNDEPASVLLERIIKEKEAAAQAKKAKEVKTVKKRTRKGCPTGV